MLRVNMLMKLAPGDDLLSRLAAYKPDLILRSLRLTISYKIYKWDGDRHRDILNLILQYCHNMNSYNLLSMNL